MPRVQRGKVSATFEAREAAGCGSLRLLRALDGTRILQAAAPTAPPCFGHWPRSSPLQTKGCSPLIIPKEDGLHTKNPSRSAKEFFVLRRFTVACATKRKGNSMFSCCCECSRREPASAHAVCRYDLSRENAMPGGPQTARHCSIINMRKAKRRAF